MNLPLSPKKIGVQLGAIVGLSLALGTVFNSANPIGIAWANGSPSASPAGTAKLSVGSHEHRHEPVSAQQTSVSSASVQWTEVKPLFESGQIVLVDARPTKTFDLYRIPGAVSLPFDSTEEQLKAFRQRYDTNTHLVIYCANAKCIASSILADKLRPLGYHRIQIMKEGYFGWLAQTQDKSTVSLSKRTGSNETSPSTPVPAGNKVKTAETASHERGAAPFSEHSPDPPVASPDDFSAPNPSPTTWEMVKPLMDTGTILLVDVRSALTFRAGHIPGAINLPESSSKPADYLAFKERYDPSTPIVLYCSSITCSVSKRMGIRLATEFGFENVRYLTGGFQAWQKAEHSPERFN